MPFTTSAANPFLFPVACTSRDGEAAVAGAAVTAALAVAAAVAVEVKLPIAVELGLGGQERQGRRRAGQPRQHPTQLQMATHLSRIRKLSFDR